MTKLPDPTQDLLGAPFWIASIIEVPPPEGAEGVWQRYVIMQGSSNTITGLRSGTRLEVSMLVESMVQRLNERFEKREARVGAALNAGRNRSRRVVARRSGEPVEGEPSELPNGSSQSTG
jgi:hypothetical protein